MIAQATTWESEPVVYERRYYPTLYQDETERLEFLPAVVPLLTSFMGKKKRVKAPPPAPTPAPTPAGAGIPVYVWIGGAVVLLFGFGLLFMMGRRR